MPELPEVEVTRAGLSDRLQGARVLGLRLGKPLRWPLGRSPEGLSGLQVGPLARRGKYLWMPLEAPAADVVDVAVESPVSGGLLWHLGMSGSLGLSDGSQPAGPHDHVELRTSRGTLRLTDPRRFGAVLWSSGLTAEPAARLLAKLGPEPFDPALTPERLHAGLQQRRSAVKTALLSGELVVGAGNIYASEALFRAGIDPRTECRRLSRPRCERLLAELRLTLGEAIALGGSTLRDFRDAHGMQGAFQQQALVYGREGQPCRRCDTPILRLVQGQRATYYCPRCQRR